MKMYSMRKKPVESKVSSMDEEPMQEAYPYGLQLRFDTDEVVKVPELSRVEVGETVHIQAVGTVTGMNINQDQKRTRKSVEIQIKQIGLSDKADEDFAGGWKQATKSK